MTRKERRAAEHIARKAARKAGYPEPQPAAPVQEQQPAEAAAAAEPTPEPTPAPEPKKQISEAQLAANRANAQRSTGPSPSSFAKTCQNALKHGLTGRAVVLPGEDGALYEARLLAYQKEFQPVGPEETELLQSIVDVRWRLGRIPGLETATLVVGRKTLTEEDPQLVAECDSVTLEWYVRQRFEKSFHNLRLQERHLVKRRENEMKELRQLQANRKAATAAEANPPETKPAAKPAEPEKPAPAAAPPSPNGFVFENSEIEDFLAAASLDLSQFLAQETPPVAKPRQ